MKKCVVVYNPHSGRKIKKDFFASYIDILLDNGYDAEIIKSEYRGNITEIVSSLPDCDLVISMGGDGTFNEAVKGNLKRNNRLTLAHIPLGTTNDIGAMFGYASDPVENLKLLMNGVEKNIDICTINDSPFVYVAGFGKFMNVPYETSRKLKKKFGYLAYIGEATKEFFSRTKLYDITYEVDGEKYRGLFSFLLLSSANRIAGINKFYKEVKLDDGKFEVLLCNLTRKKDVIRSMFHAATSDITKVPGFYFYKTDNIKITCHNQIRSWCVDGEKLDDKSMVYNVKVVPDFKIRLPKKNIKNLFITDGEPNKKEVKNSVIDRIIKRGK